MRACAFGKGEFVRIPTYYDAGWRFMQKHLIRSRASSSSHDLHRSAFVAGPPRYFDHSEHIMSSDYSPTTPPKSSHATRKTSSSFRVSDANIRNLAPVARIMKMALPENAKIAKEAKECMQECVSEFISFITSEGKSQRIIWPTMLFVNVAQHQRSASRRSARR